MVFKIILISICVIIFGCADIKYFIRCPDSISFIPSINTALIEADLNNKIVNEHYLDYISGVYVGFEWYLDPRKEAIFRYTFWQYARREE